MRVVGRTVDECVYLFCLLEKTCQQQLLAEAAEANGLTKRIIAPQDAAYTQESNGYWETMYNNVSLRLADGRVAPAGHLCWLGCDRLVCRRWG
jgi:ribulose-5-phosphate 4-epimerase/fuculose-1-phosphate aldolase